MHRKLLPVLLAFALILCACAPAVQAPLSPPTVETAAKEAAATTDIPKAKPTAASKAEAPAAPEAGQIASSLLAAVWDPKKQEYWLKPLSPESGEALPGYEPVSLGESYYQALSPDRQRLALAVLNSVQDPSGGDLLLFDPHSWSSQKLPLDVNGMVTAMQFSPDGKKLALAYGNAMTRVAIFDLDRLEVAAETLLEMFVSQMRFARDGGSLLLYGTVIVNRFTAEEATSGPPRVVLLGADDLAELWSADLEGVRDGIYPKDETKDQTADLHQPGEAIYYFPGLAFAPDRDALYLVHPGEELLTTVDFAAHQVETIDIQPQLSWFERLLALTAGVAHAKVAEGTSLRAQVSPDGELLYVVGSSSRFVDLAAGNLDLERTPLGLRVIRIADGALLGHLDSPAEEISISPDGETLYLHQWLDRGSRTEVVSSADLKVTASLEGRLAPVLCVGGEPLLASTDWLSEYKSRMQVVRPQDLSALADWSSVEYTIFLGTP